MGLPCASKLPLADALAIVRASVQPLATESVPVAQAGLRVLAEPLRARTAAPRGAVAAMDGFAVREVDIRAGHRDFAIADHAGHAGGDLPEAMRPLTAYRIMTGALVPPGAERVIPWELVRETAGRIRLEETLPVKPHVRAAGSDFRAGQLLLEEGTLLDAPRMLVASAADRSVLKVHRRPRVRVLSSGNELVAPGDAPEDVAAVPESLTAAMLLVAAQWGADALGSDVVRDDVGEIRSAAEAALADSDVLVVIGGASGGDRDLARPALDALGLDQRFAGVAMRPGKPTWFGRVGQSHVIGLPGNPVAALIVARLFLASLLCQLGGRGFDAALRWRASSAEHPLPPGEDRELLLLARRIEGRARVIDKQSASAQLPLAQAEMLLRRPAGCTAVAAGEVVSVLDL